jgi:predicted ATP-dependent serine protease
MPKKPASIKTIRPCIKCGSLEKATSGRCKPCGHRMTDEWRKRNPDKHKKYVKKWRDKNTEKVKADVKAYSEKWHKENKEKIKARNAARYRAKKAARQPDQERSDS